MMHHPDRGTNLPAPAHPAPAPPVPAHPASHAASSAPAAVPDALSLLRALRRRWVLAATLGVLAGAAVAGLAYTLVPAANYKAQAMLRVASYNPRVLVETAEARSDFRTYQKTQEAMIKSRLVLEEALKAPEVETLPRVQAAADPIEWLEKEVQVDYAPGSEILRIGFSGKDPREVKILTNAVTNAYLDKIVEAEAEGRRKRYDALKEIWTGYQNRLKEKRDELKRLAEAAGSDDKQALALIHQSEQGRLGRAEDELARVRTELRGLQVEVKVLRRQAAAMAGGAAAAPTAASIDEMVERDDRVAAQVERIEDARRRIAQLGRLVVNRADPTYQRLRRELADATAAADDLRARLRPAYQKQPVARPANDESRTKLVMMEERVKVLTDLETSLSDDVKRLSERAKTITRTTVDLAKIQDEISAADGLAKRVGAEVEVMSVELQAPPKVELVEDAALPRTKDEMKRVKVAGIGGMGALVAVLAGVSFVEWKARRIASAHEVSHALGLRIVGTLPAAPVPGRLGGPDPDREFRWQCLLTESVDAARTALLHASRNEPMRLVMIASALGGEGKTSLSAHLAGSLARAGRRTLLLDCDLRRPSINRLFDIEQGPGMCEVLRREVAPADAIRPGGVANLSILPAGWCDAEAIHALARPDARAIFDHLRTEYDFVVVDTSPVLPVTDALLIAEHVDAVLFSVMRDVSRAPMVHTAYQRLASLGTRMLGAVVTGEATLSYGGRYEYQYRYANRPGAVAEAARGEEV